MVLYYRTSAAGRILARGFGDANGHGRPSTSPSAVVLSDLPLEDQHGSWDTDLLVVELPDDAIRRCEWREGANTPREYLVSVALIDTRGRVRPATKMERELGLVLRDFPYREIEAWADDILRPYQNRYRYEEEMRAVPAVWVVGPLLQRFPIHAQSWFEWARPRLATALVSWAELVFRDSQVQRHSHVERWKLPSCAPPDRERHCSSA